MTKETMLVVDELINIDTNICQIYHINHKGDYNRVWKTYLEEIALNVTEKVSQEVIDELEEENHHSLVEALIELNLVQK